MAGTQERGYGATGLQWCGVCAMMGRGVTVMQLKKINNNQKVIGFLHFIAEGNRAYKAGEKAGFSAPRRDIAQMMHSPELGARVSEAVLHRCRTVLLPEAMVVTEALLTDKRVNPRIRWDIAKTLLATAGGIVAPKAKELEGAPKEISQMSGDDIMKLREQLQAEQAKRSEGAKVIEHEPESPESLNFLD